ncbi:uncharacterized protein LOC106732098 isoform X2 [Pelodiscus sinensis]|uniref:uncharacterized protein LOC106732098 isoform X2 n=1 Tax=Pelodiscus sinensis TaxID=13735 RepID=UPI000D7238FE|nr:uncharacterized protein LOC106732098 isoform X2 [Pelodiscus sinensis]|eukprot:XP_025041031.1 uncharacterized protein LOC106732098 isoform X2 [Pelodiscus sinensis]
MHSLCCERKGVPKIVQDFNLMAIQKMRTIRGSLIECGRGSLIVALLLTALGIKDIGCDTLEIIYPSNSVTLKEGDSLTLNCTVRYQLNQSSDPNVYWCKHVDNQNDCAKVGRELEHFPSTEHSNPQARVILSLQLHNVSQSHSGGYQCRASGRDKSAVGHYIRVKVIGNPEAVSEGNKVLRMDSWLEKIRTLIMILWMILP